MKEDVLKKVYLRLSFNKSNKIDVLFVLPIHFLTTKIVAFIFVLDIVGSMFIANK